MPAHERVDEQSERAGLSRAKKEPMNTRCERTHGPPYPLPPSTSPQARIVPKSAPSLKSFQAEEGNQFRTLPELAKAAATGRYSRPGAFYFADLAGMGAVYLRPFCRGCIFMASAQKWEAISGPPFMKEAKTRRDTKKKQETRDKKDKEEERRQTEEERRTNNAA